MSFAFVKFFNLSFMHKVMKTLKLSFNI
jgi:hypothetical protein